MPSKNLAIISFTKLASYISRRLNLGNGSTWPGHIALKFNRNFIKDIIKKNKHLKIVFIAGTNGKTTTSKLAQFILEKNGKKVFHNESGANLLNGLASSIINHVNINGDFSHDVAIFEVDENILPRATDEIKPDAVVILNLFRDQLDRYGEVNAIALKWQNALKKLSSDTLLFINGDDPQLSFIGQESKLETHFFGIDKKYMVNKALSHDVDFIYCPKCNNKLTFTSFSYSHLGEFICTNCGFTNPKREIPQNLEYPLMGTYNIYNVNAAYLLLKKAFSIDEKTFSHYLKDFKPAFGRQESLEIKGKKIQIFLSKNPTGLNESLRTIKDLNAKHVLFVLNDRIPDGRDVSWIWDAGFEEFINTFDRITVSGDRTYDMALRIKYTLPRHSELVSESRSRNEFGMTFQIEENIQKAIKIALNQTPPTQTLYILPTYSAMLEVRKILTGRKIL